MVLGKLLLLDGHTVDSAEIFHQRVSLFELIFYYLTFLMHAPNTSTGEIFNAAQSG